MFCLRQFSFRYAQTSMPALNDIDLDVHPGEFIVITGASGCGKTTLALALAGFLFQDGQGDSSGEIKFNGQDWQQLPLHQMAHQVGLVQQNPELQFCTLTVHDEIAFGLENLALPENEIRERVAAICGKISILQLLDRPLDSLSGGEKQKVAIASVLALNPSLLILDEPTSNLDPEATLEILNVVDHLRQQHGLAVIIIEHKLAQLAKFNPRLVLMDAGKIITNPAVLPQMPAVMPAPSTSTPHQPPADAAPILQVENVSLSRNGHTILTQINFAIHPGEFIALTSANGTGKTSLLLALIGINRPDAGTITFNQKNTAHMSVSSLARSCGFVFQNPDHQLFTASVDDEIHFSLKNFKLMTAESENISNALLGQFGITEKLAEHPFKLSYGQKRRLNLICALNYQPALILLDEILIGQDQKNAALLLATLKAYTHNGGAVILANHHPDLTQSTITRVIHLEDGHICVDANPHTAYAALRQQGKTCYTPQFEPNHEGSECEHIV